MAVDKVKSLASRYTAVLVVILVALTAGMNAIMGNYFAEYYNSGFVAIPIYFLITGALILALVSRSVCDSKKYTKVYLLTRTIKILSFIIFCIVCMVLMPESKVHFMLAALAFALVYMIFEAVVLLKFNKEVHEIQQNNQK